MKFGSVCSGIEAASVAWKPLGWEPEWFAEIEPFPSAVLKHHYPQVPNLGDMTALPERILSGEIEAPEVFCGGTPCQAFSVAGNRESLADARGNLTLTFCEVANAIDTIRAQRGMQPCIIFWENVPGVLNTKDNAFGCFLGALAGEDCALEPPGGRWTDAGCVLGPERAIAWRTLDAQFFQLAQRRRRVFVVASARDDLDPTEILFEFDGMRRDFAPSREAGKVASTIPARSTGGGGMGTDFDLDGGLIPALSQCITTGTVQRYDPETETILPVTHTLRGEGFDASEDGTGRGTPLVPVSVAMRGRDGGAACEVGDDCAFTLRASGGGGDKPHVLAPVAFDTTQITSAANYSNPQPGDPCHPLAAGAHAPAIAFPANLSGTQHASTENLAPSMGAKNPTAVAVALRGRDGGATAEVGDDCAFTLRASTGGGDKPHALTGIAVRRLTPRECERLQGFPDDYTAIPWRKKPASECPDGPRYRALGNSWAVPVVAWIGRRIAAEVAPSTIPPPKGERLAVEE